jgi:hypothetical protein
MVEHDQIVPAEAHLDSLTVLEERKPVRIERIDQRRDPGGLAAE